MDEIQPNKIPIPLRKMPNWVLWKSIMRDGSDKPTKLPYQVNGEMAKSDDASTWNTFEAVWHRFQKGGYSGIGLMFPEDRSLCGIDLDGCRNPETGEMAPWARAIVERFSTYTEVSPSKTGVKLWIVGQSPFESGRKVELANELKMCEEKSPGIEVYDHKRYFAVTGLRVRGPVEPQERQDKIQWLTDLYFQPKVSEHRNGSAQHSSVTDRAAKYVAKMPPAISGSGGHNAAFRVACVLVLGFGLSESEALGIMHQWNATCQPPWSDRELLHKVRQANKQAGERCYLRDAQESSWAGISIPDYQEHAAKQSPEKKTHTLVTIKEATQRYLSDVESGKELLISSGIPEVDKALGGGFAYGEMVVLAALSSHGKSMIGLQWVHQWTRQGIPCFIDSEEMTVENLGKRALQWISDVPEEDWRHQSKAVQKDVEHYAKDRAACYIAESIGNASEVVETIDLAVREHGVKCAIVDYAQYLTTKSRSKYEQVSEASQMLKQCAIRNNIILVSLVQMNRDIEKRDKFLPKMSDIKDSGQIGQDADVVMFACWPHRIDQHTDANEYWFYFAKNRNRGIHAGAVKCKFYPSRQMVTSIPVKESRNYEPEFDKWNDNSF